MKLRNKKTGEIIIPTDYTFTSCGDGIRYGHHTYCSLAELNEEWEDYKPTEPLIKDEKVRKAVRAWAEAFGVTKVYVCGIGRERKYIELYALDDGDTYGIFRISIPIQDGVSIDERHTIAELCGEEEECRITN